MKCVYHALSYEEGRELDVWDTWGWRNALRSETLLVSIKTLHYTYIGVHPLQPGWASYSCSLVWIAKGAGFLNKNLHYFFNCLEYMRQAASIKDLKAPCICVFGLLDGRSWAIDFTLKYKRVCEFHVESCSLSGSTCNHPALHFTWDVDSGHDVLSVSLSLGIVDDSFAQHGISFFNLEETKETP